MTTCMKTATRAATLMNAAMTTAVTRASATTPWVTSATPLAVRTAATASMTNTRASTAIAATAFEDAAVKLVRTRHFAATSMFLLNHWCQYHILLLQNDIHCTTITQET